MARYQKVWLLILCFCLPFAVWAGGPSIVLKDFAGKDRNVNEFIGQGKWTVVTVWAHDCHICNLEIHQMTFFHDEHKAKDAIVLGVAVDGWEKRELAQEFVDRHALNFTNLIAEPEQSILMKFGAGPFVGTPTFYVYGPDGKLLAQNIGPVTQEDIESFMNEFNAKNKKDENKN